MSAKTKTFIGIIILVLFILLAFLAYDKLSKNYKAETSFELAAAKTAGPTETNAETITETATNAEASPTENSTTGNNSTTEPEQTAEPEPILAPNFVVYDKDGNETKLSDYFGKPIVLNFWASWCPPCKSEMPHFNKVYGEVGEEITFLMVDMVDGMQETEEKGKKYIEENEFAFPVLYDLDEDAANAYGIRSIPTTILIDKDGYIVTGVEGAIDEETLLIGIDLIR